MNSLKYVPDSTNHEKNVFTEEFYSGVDVDVYINDSKCDFISNISYSLQEQLNPLYGYASYTYNDMSVGNRIIIGTIRVPIGSSKDFDNLKNEAENIPLIKIPIAEVEKPTWANLINGSRSKTHNVTFEQIRRAYEEQIANGTNVTGKVGT